ncbi:MAG: hypothetical protein A2428_03675 [Bdellovibrionales bacterium RIFOXYC1_FULL_54_43]|nr:MAG: hypothetical protein A2428_03675 [Bdellovibrionales bacterium RIFOXYC1_FULL_54_43]OFZ83811.1 MAG: hypothetical protein A2603_11100 [Bdellovibrionales bacterium RIFOXYD1_FULL_55_31]
MQKKGNDPLEQMRTQVREAISKAYPTVEDFCWENELSKATLSNFLNDKKDFQISTLIKIANALRKKLTIRLD